MGDAVLYRSHHCRCLIATRRRPFHAPFSVYCQYCYRWKHIEVTDTLRDRMCPFTHRSVARISGQSPARSATLSAMWRYTAHCPAVAAHTDVPRRMRRAAPVEHRGHHSRRASPWPHITNQDRFSLPSLVSVTLGSASMAARTTQIPDPFIEANSTNEGDRLPSPRNYNGRPIGSRSIPRHSESGTVARAIWGRKRCAIVSC